MKQWWLVMALLLSVGINIGILAGRAWPGRGAVDNGGGTVEGPEAEAPPADPRTSWRGRQPRFVERMATELGLEGEDRERFIERQASFFEQTVTARIQFGRLQNELRRELIEGRSDRDRIDALLEEIAAAHIELERAFVDNLFDTREILTPEQQRRFLYFLHHLRRSGDDVRRRLREEFQRPGGRDFGNSRQQPWRRRPMTPPPAEPPPADGP